MKRNRLDRLALQIFNTPLLINSDKLTTILSVVGPRILLGEEIEMPVEMAARRDGEKEFPGGGIITETGVGVLPIVGTTVRRGSFLDSMSGLCSYGMIVDGAEALLADARTKGLLFEIDSPGGEAGGCFEASRQLRALGAKYGKPIWAHANDMACSAGYALACSADKILVTELGEVGSIGVVAAHVDGSEADKKAGLKWTFITAGKHKVDGNSHEPLSKEAKSKFQDDIDTIYGMFVDLVAESRGMSADKIRETEAEIFMGQKAVSAGLADSVSTFDGALAAFAEFLNSKATIGTRPNAPSTTSHRSEPMAKKPGASAASVEAGNEGIVENKAAPAEAAADEGAEAGADEDGIVQAKNAKPKAAIEDPHARTLAIFDLKEKATKLGVGFDVAKALKSNLSIEKLNAMVLDAAANADEDEGITTFGTSATAREASSAAEARAGWDAALSKAYAKRGRKLATA